MLTAAVELGDVGVGPADGEVDAAVLVLVGGLHVVEGGAPGAAVTGALMPATTECVSAKTSEKPV